jgi:hypothetical protein
VASIGFSRQTSTVPQQKFQLLMHVDGPGGNDATNIPLNDWIFTDGWDLAAMWADAWFDVGIQVGNGNIDLSLSGPGVTGGSHTYTYDGEMEIDAVIQLSGRAFEPTYPGSPDNRDVLFDNVAFTVPEPMTMTMLAIGGIALIRRRRRRRA